MEEKDIIAIKLGFESAEEMEKYHDLCRGAFKDGVIMTKELCAREIIGNGWEELLEAPREDRLEEKLRFDFDGLIESMRFADDGSAQRLKALIEFELSELRKCYANREKKPMR